MQSVAYVFESSRGSIILGYRYIQRAVVSLPCKTLHPTAFKPTRNTFYNFFQRFRFATEKLMPWQKGTSKNNFVWRKGNQQFVEKRKTSCKPMSNYKVTQRHGEGIFALFFCFWGNFCQILIYYVCHSITQKQILVNSSDCFALKCTLLPVFTKVDLAFVLFQVSFSYTLRKSNIIVV